ncbi:MAG TPA: acylphosphatase [Bacteroidales bacterium]|nr:acylphosphatase [Bacteroidales bacterium]
MSEQVLYKIHIRGRVQGVGFRWNAAREARDRQIKGFVRNLSDGSVYIEAEGKREILEDFIGWCRMGPSFSSVESVEVNSFPPAGYKDFVISH